MPIELNLIFVFLTFSYGVRFTDLDSVLFDVSISHIPIRSSEDSDTSIHILSKYGQTFVCRIPETNVSTNHDSHITFELSTLNDILLKLNSSRCLSLQIGWWTFKLCIGKDIKQYHDESYDILLGEYHKDFNWSSVSTKDPEYTSKYHSQFYINGDPCDVTGLMRQVEVRYHCSNGHLASILEVIEPMTCKYIITVGIPELCEIDFYKPKQDVSMNLISCSPLLDNKNFDAFTKAENNKKFMRENAERLIKYKSILSKLPVLREDWKLRHLYSFRSYRRRILAMEIVLLVSIKKDIIEFFNLLETNFEKFINVQPEFILSITQLHKPQHWSDFISSNSSSEHKISVEFNRTLYLTLSREDSLQKDSKSVESLIIIGQFIHLSSSLLRITRIYYEQMIRNAKRPLIYHMLFAYINILNKLASLNKAKSIRTIEELLLDYSSNSKIIKQTNDFHNQFDKLPETVNEIRLIQSLNITLEQLKGLIKLVHMRKLVFQAMRSLNSDSSLDFPISYSLAENAHRLLMPKDASDTTTQDDETDTELLSSTISDIMEMDISLVKKYLESFKTQNSINNLLKNKVVLAGNKGQPQESVTFYIVIEEKDKDKSKEIEKSKNYAFRWPSK